MWWASKKRLYVQPGKQHPASRALSARRIAGGELGVRVEERATGELKALVQTFNKMTVDLKATTDKLLASERINIQLIATSEQRGMSGLRGHRSVGGMRASIYNAFPEEGVHRLVALLAELE